MYGWRGRIGFVVPSNNTVLEPEVYSAVPDGVTAHFARVLSTGMDAARLLEMSGGAGEAFGQLAAGAPDSLLYACMATSVSRGRDWDEEISRSVTAATGLPCETAARATFRAVSAVTSGSIGVLTPYPLDLHAALLEQLVAGGISVGSDRCLDIEDPMEVCQREPEDIFRVARSVAHDGASAILIVATDLPTLRVIGSLETDLGIPVVTTNQAMLWSALAMIGCREPLIGYGRLLADPQLRNEGRQYWSAAGDAGQAGSWR